MMKFAEYIFAMPDRQNDIYEFAKMAVTEDVCSCWFEEYENFNCALNFNRSLKKGHCKKILSEFVPKKKNIKLSLLHLLKKMHFWIRFNAMQVVLKMSEFVSFVLLQLLWQLGMLCWQKDSDKYYLNYTFKFC